MIRRIVMQSHDDKLSLAIYGYLSHVRGAVHHKIECRSDTLLSARLIAEHSTMVNGGSNHMFMRGKGAKETEAHQRLPKTIFLRWVIRI